MATATKEPENKAPAKTSEILWKEFHVRFPKVNTTGIKDPGSWLEFRNTNVLLRSTYTPQEWSSMWDQKKLDDSLHPAPKPTENEEESNKKEEKNNHEDKEHTIHGYHPAEKKMLVLPEAADDETIANTLTAPLPQVEIKLQNEDLHNDARYLNIQDELRRGPKPIVLDGTPYNAEKETEKRFKERYSADVAEYEKKEKTKIYTDPTQDPHYKQVMQQAKEAADKRFEAQKQALPKGDTKAAEELRKQINTQSYYQHLAAFANARPEKASAYATNNPELERITTHLHPPATQNPTEAPKITIKPIPELPPEEEEIIEYEETPPSPVEVTVIDEPGQEPTPDIAPEEPPQQQPQQRGKQGNNMRADLSKKLGKRMLKQQLKRFIAQRGAQAAAAALLGPEAIIAIGIGIGIILLVIIIIVLVFAAACAFPNPFFSGCNTNGGNSTGTGSSSDTPIPGLTLQLTGPSQIENSNNISYTLAVSYTGSQDLILTDKLPQNTEFVSSTGKTKDDQTTIKQQNTLSWTIKDNLPGGVSTSETKNMSFTFVLKPLQNDINVRNKVVAQYVSPPVDPNGSDFVKLMTGQGRLTNVLGDEDSFTKQVIANGTAYKMAEKESYIRKVYKVASAKNVNPLAVLATWGTEAGFKLNGTEFGCDPRGQGYPGFENQLYCGANTWDKWMNYFDQNKDTNGTLELKSQVGKKCIYSDSFIFAAEKYGPECVINDANDYFRSNFVKFYKQFLGQ